MRILARIDPPATARASGRRLPLSRCVVIVSSYVDDGLQQRSGSELQAIDDSCGDTESAL